MPLLETSMSALIATIALFISIFSFLGAKKAERYTGLRNELSNLPAIMPEKRLNPRGGQVGLLIKNRGTGIAIIDKILITHQPDITIDAAQNSDWVSKLKSALADSAIQQRVVEIKDNVTPVKNVYFASIASGSVLNVGEELWLFQGDPENLNANEMQTVIEWIKNLEVRVIYFSVYMKQFDSKDKYEVFIQRINTFYLPWISRKLEHIKKHR